MDWIEYLRHLDTDLFLYLNGMGTSTWDGFWNFVTHRFTWVPVYLILLYLVYRLAGWKGFVFYLIAISILILVVDQTTYYWFKAIFQRPRPSHNPDIADVIRITGRAGGRWGFISAHASNTFAIAVFLGSQFKKIYKPAAALFTLWAVFISYSRIYVGVHYPGDLIVGALWGASVAYLFLWILKITDLNKKLDLSIYKKSKTSSY